jgi:hypothetical protein
VHIKDYEIPEVNDQSKLIESLEKSEIPYFFNAQTQTDLYYYTQAIFKLKQTVHVFYDKRDNTSKNFERFTENVSFNPIYWCDDFVLGVSNHFYTLDKMLNHAILNDLERQKLLAIQDDNNPCLIKYFFKK